MRKKEKNLQVREKGKDAITASNRQKSLQRKRICSTALSTGDRTKLFDFAFNLTFLAIMMHWKILAGKYADTVSRV